MENLGSRMAEIMEKHNWGEKAGEIYRQILQDPDIRTFLNEHRDELDSEAVSRGMSKLIEYVDFRDRYRAGQKTMIPGYYPVLSVSSRQIQIDYAPTSASLERRRQSEIRHRVTAVNVPKSVRNASLQEYRPDTKGRAKALQYALQFSNEYGENPGEFHRGMYLSGKFGVGKTYLLGALANELAEKGFSTTILHVPTFIEDLKSLFGRDTGQTVSDAVNRVKSAPVLMLDDIGADSLSNWSRDDILGVILQYRMQEELPTFFSSNLSMADLERDYLTSSNRMDADELKSGRIMERVRFLADEFLIDGPNRRNYR